MGLSTAFQPPPDSYPNHLSGLEPQRLKLPPACWLLVLLVLVCLAPRAVMALRIPSICPDGVLYVHVAQMIGAGQWRQAFQGMTPNLYPVVLMLLHRAGLDWQSGAALWGVVLSSLVVLPLWGWARRQFDDRVALLACLLYAVHPKFIEWSPEVMRDPTFWFLFMLAIYYSWRAATEVRLAHFMAAGAAILLAALTRTEGLFLLIPLILWTFWRWRALRTDHRRRLMGAACCVVILAMLFGLLGVGWAWTASSRTAFEWNPLARVGPWLEHLFSRTSTHIEGSVETPLTFGRMLWVFFPTMTRGLSPIFALLMFGGIWGWRRVWFRRDNQPLFYTAMAVVCGIWIQMGYDSNICPRYALPIVLLGAPFAALGVLGLVGRMLRVLGWLSWDRLRVAVIPTVATVVAVVGLTDAMISNTRYFETRRMARDVGAWAQRQSSSRPMLVGPVGITPVVAFYAQDSRYQAFLWEWSDAAIAELVRTHKADIVVLQPARELTVERCRALVERMELAGLRPIRSDALPPDCRGLFILVRPSAAVSVAVQTRPERRQ